MKLYTIFSMFTESIILKNGLRSDRLWLNPLLFHEPLRRIPFYLDVMALLQSRYWQREKTKALALRRFKETVQNASAIPFWNERFKRAAIDPDTFSEKDIPRIPLLSKKDFVDKNVGYYTNKKLFSKSSGGHTSGSTGRPFHFYHDRGFELRSSAISERMFLAAGNGKRFPVIVMKSFPEFGLSFAKHNFFYIRSYNSIRYRVHELEKLISSLHSKVILFSLGSSLLELARICRDLHISLPIQKVISTGEELRDFQREEIEKSLQTQVLITYGMSEFRRLAFECRYGRLHIGEETLYMEITDDKGIPLPAGETGRIVVTGFENRVMPFIRYDTGDMGVIKEDPCECGQTSRTIELHGRQVMLIDIGDGRTISLMDISCALFDRYHNEISQFQIIRTDECAFTIRVIPARDFEKAKDILTENLKLRMHPQASINWEKVNLIPEGPSGKAVYFVDEFKKR